MISCIVSRLVILVFGTLYPAYASYKAVKSKNVKEYVKWMMYWIVFALFTCAETITDVFLSWFPFYYEIKIVLVIWLLSPATKGSSFLYRKFVHPLLSSKEQEIDEYLSKAKEQSYKQVLDLGSKGVNALMQTALKSGGGLVNHIKKSYSLSDLSEHHAEDEVYDESDAVVAVDNRLLRKRPSPRRAPSTSLYFPEIDVRQAETITSVHSVEDISATGDAYMSQSLKLQAREGLVRTASLTGRAKPTRVTRSTIVPRKAAATAEVDISDSDNIVYLNDRLEHISDLTKIPESSDSSSSDGEFCDTFEETSPGKSEESALALVIGDTSSVDLTATVPDTNISNDITKPQEISKAEELPGDVVRVEENISEVLVNENDEAFEECNNMINNLSPITEMGEEIEDKNNGNNEIVVESNDASLQNVIVVTEEAQKEETLQQQSILHKDSLSLEQSSIIQEIIEQDPIISPNDNAEERAGKYHKKTAPVPPKATPTIKATLVLKPGIIKPLGASDDKTEVFCHSPKLKRRSLSRSRSPSPKAGRARKHESTISKLLMLPKKLFKNEESHSSKRNSWHDVSQPSLYDQRLQSQSSTSIFVPLKEDAEEATLIRELSESPSSRRRARGGRQCDSATNQESI